MSNTIYLSSHTLEVHPYIFKTLKLRHNNNIQESTSQQLYLNTRVLDFQRQRPDTYRRRPFAADQKRWSWSLFQLLKKKWYHFTDRCTPKIWRWCCVSDQQDHHACRFQHDPPQEWYRPLEARYTSKTQSKNGSRLLPEIGVTCLPGNKTLDYRFK